MPPVLEHSLQHYCDVTVYGDLGVSDCHVQGARERFDVVIVDTAGRLQIDERMMGELQATQRAIKPSDTLLVVDAMTGQEAASLTKAFNDATELTGMICNLKRLCDTLLIWLAACTQLHQVLIHSSPLASSSMPAPVTLLLVSNHGLNHCRCICPFEVGLFTTPMTE